MPSSKKRSRASATRCSGVVKKGPAGSEAAAVGREGAGALAGMRTPGARNLY